MSCAQEGYAPSAIFMCPGFMLHHIMIDAMHATDLGVFQDALGGVFWCELTCRRFYPNQKTGLAALNRSLKLYYRANPGLSSVLPLAMSQIRAPTSENSGKPLKLITKSH